MAGGQGAGGGGQDYPFLCFLRYFLAPALPTQGTEVWCPPPPWRREIPEGCALFLAAASSSCGPPPPAGCCCSPQRPASRGPTPLLPLLLSNRSSLAPSLLLLLRRTILELPTAPTSPQPAWAPPCSSPLATTAPSSPVPWLSSPLAWPRLHMSRASSLQFSVSEKI